MVFINTADAALPLSSPEKGEILDTLTPTFQWQKSDRPDILQYTVSICPDPLCVRLIYSSVYDSPALTSTSYTIPSGILKPNYLTGTNTPYYWQVWGRNTYSYNFEKSEIRDFWIKGTASNTATTSETAKCYKDGDCGADYYVGDRFCLENNADPNNVYRNNARRHFSFR